MASRHLQETIRKHDSFMIKLPSVFVSSFWVISDGNSVGVVPDVDRLLDADNL